MSMVTASIDMHSAAFSGGHNKAACCLTRQRVVLADSEAVHESTTRTRASRGWWYNAAQNTADKLTKLVHVCLFPSIDQQDSVPADIALFCKAFGVRTRVGSGPGPGVKLGLGFGVP